MSQVNPNARVDVIIVTVDNNRRRFRNLDGQHASDILNNATLGLGASAHDTEQNILVGYAPGNIARVIIAEPGDGEKTMKIGKQ